MPVDLDTQLRALGDALVRESAPITLDELGAGEVIATPAAPGRRRWAAVAAIATAAAAVVGIVAIGTPRDGGDLASGPTATEPPAGGVLVADPAAPGGWTLQSATAGLDPGDGNRTVFYATDSVTPEEAPSLVLITPAAVGTGGEPEGAVSFTIAAVGESWWWSTSEVDMTVAFEIDGVGYAIQGHGVTEDQLRLAAEHVLPADAAGGARIEAAGLPAGVVERAVGTTIETWFFDDAAVERGLPNQRWLDEDGRPMWLTVARGDVDLVTLARIGRSSVSDIEVRGAAGVVAQDHGDTEFRSVVWADGGATYFLGARAVPTDEMLGFAETLRPATAEAWTALVDDDLPDEAPEIGVAEFPLLDDAAAVGLTGDPDASFTSMPATDFDAIRAWRAVLGRPDGAGYRDLIVVEIVTGLRAPNADGHVDTAVTELPTFFEYVFDSGDVRITLQADMPAEAAQVVSRSFTVVGNRLPEIARLPDGLITVAEPYPLMVDAGHFPVLAYEGVTVSVNPSPAAGLMAAPGGSLAQVVIAGRPSYVSDDETGLVDIASELDDGTTLQISAAGMSMDQVVAIAEAVQLVDQRTWIERYQPRWVDEVGKTVDLPAPITVPPSDTVSQTTSVASDTAAVQQRLTELGFDPGPVDGVNGEMTQQAVWAFEKLILGVPRSEVTGTVSPEMWQRMQEPVIVAPRRPQEAGVDHVEIHLPEQVMVVFHDDTAVLVTHISTGALDENGEPAEYCESIVVDTGPDGTPLPEPDEKSICGVSKTPGGIFDVDRFVPGTSVGPLGAMWNPIYFNYGIAIHGAKNVPLQPVSHGNVRVPMHVSERLPELIDVGDTVYVWNGTKEPEDQTREDELPVFYWPDPNAATP